jgi:ribonuclease HII
MPPKTAAVPLKPFYQEAPRWEIALDEAGRGPLFGRVYAAAVVLPRTDDPAVFDYSLMRDSKKITSKKKMNELANYIRGHAVTYSVQYKEADVVDRVNILQADMQCMHDCVRGVLDNLGVAKPGEGGLYRGSYRDVALLVDGNYFRDYTVYDDETQTMTVIPHTTIEQGDGKYASIAAASILAKCARDAYIAELCEQYPELKVRYALDRNMGYGSAAHLKGILEHGITQWHRKTFARCKGERENPL